MADFNVSETIDSIENSELKKLLLHLFTKLSARDERILALENRVAELEERVDECEKHSSKDCLIFENLPIKKTEGNVPTLEHQVCDFLFKYLNWETYPHNFKACHPLGSWKIGYPPPAIIVKFMYFNEKKTRFLEGNHGSLRTKQMGDRSISKNDYLASKNK